MISSSDVIQREKLKLKALDEYYMSISFKPDGTVIEANKKFCETSGYNLDDIVGKHHKMFCDTKYANSEEYRIFWEKLAEGKIQTAEFRRIKKNKDSIYIQASYQPLVNEQGEVIEIFKLAQDITKQKIESLNNHGKIEAINKSQAVIEFDTNGNILSANDNFLKIMDYTLDEIKGKHHSIFVEESFKDSDEYKDFWKKLKEGAFDSGEYLRLARNNRRVWIQATYNPIFDIDEKIVKIIKFAYDVTAEKLSILYYSGQLEAINKSQAVIEFDLQGNILNANDKFLDAMGYKLDEIVGKHHSIFVEKSYKNTKEYEEFWDKLRGGEFDTGKYERLGKNGKKVWIQATYTPILDIDKKPVKVVKFAQDITLFEKIKKDDITNFFTKEKLLVDIEELETCSIAIIDIDDYSYFLDFYGEEIGNKLLFEFSKVLRTLFNNNFEIYRINLAKFAILNSNYSKLEFLQILQDVLKVFKRTFLDLEVKKFHLFTTCGVSFEENSKLLNTAERVHKYAKKYSRDIVVYSKDLHIEEEYEKNILWTEKIKSALENDRIILFYQPIYDNKKQKVDKYEALVRLKDAEGVIHSPFFFLDIAKKSKQYLDITKVVIKKSFKKFQNTGYEFSINLTVEDICNDDLNEFLIENINKYNVGNQLVLEIVESEKITTYEPVYRFIAKIKKYGCKIAIDDFGSGYSNFEYIAKINADFVKIDGSIIKEILEDSNSMEILKSILSFCENLKIKTIAEFISSEELQEKVQSMGVDYSQGFYIGKPSPELL